MTGSLGERQGQTLAAAGDEAGRPANDAPRPHPSAPPAMFVICLSEPLDSIGSTDREPGPTMNAISFVSIGEEPWLDSSAVSAPAATRAGAQTPEELALVVRESLVRALELVRRSGFLNSASESNTEFEWRQPLTNRERDVLRLVAQGYSNRRVARTLWLSEETVKFHLGRIFRKLNVSNRTEATCWAHRNGLVSEARAAS